MKAGASTGLVACCNSFSSEMLHVYIYIYLSLLSLFSLFLQSTSFESSLLFFIPYELEIESKLECPIFRARPHARHWSFMGRCACRFFSFPIFRFPFCVSILMRWPGFSSVWRRGSISHPSERTSYVLPQDHGVLALVVILFSFWMVRPIKNKK